MAPRVMGQVLMALRGDVCLLWPGCPELPRTDLMPVLGGFSSFCSPHQPKERRPGLLLGPGLSCGIEAFPVDQGPSAPVWFWVWGDEAGQAQCTQYLLSLDPQFRGSCWPSRAKGKGGAAWKGLNAGREIGQKYINFKKSLTVAMQQCGRWYPALALWLSFLSVLHWWAQFTALMNRGTCCSGTQWLWCSRSAAAPGLQLGSFLLKC